MNPLKEPLAVETGQRYFIDVVPFSTAIGLRFVGNRVGHLAFDLPWREDLVGDVASGALHGNALTTMFDAVCGGAVLTRTPEPRRIVTLDLRVDYLRPSRRGQTVHALAECYALHGTVASARAIAHDGDPDDPVASAVGTFIVFDADNQDHPRAGDPSTWKGPYVA